MQYKVIVTKSKLMYNRRRNKAGEPIWSIWTLKDVNSFFWFALKAYHGWNTHPWSFSGWHASEESEEPRLLLNDMCHHLPKSMVCALIVHYSNYWSFTVWKLRRWTITAYCLLSFLCTPTSGWNPSIRSLSPCPIRPPNPHSEICYHFTFRGSN